VFKGLSQAPKWVPDKKDRSDVKGGAGALSRCVALGFEHGLRCLDVEREELHVVQQLRYSPKEYGRFAPTPPKAGSSGTVDRDPVVGERLQRRPQIYAPAEVEMLDLTGRDPVRRLVPMYFTSVHGNAFTDRTWSGEWVKRRDGRPIRSKAPSRRCGTSKPPD
jgi:hypothetical protein